MFDADLIVKNWYRGVRNVTLFNEIVITFANLRRIKNPELKYFERKLFKLLKNNSQLICYEALDNLPIFNWKTIFNNLKETQNANLALILFDKLDQSFLIYYTAKKFLFKSLENDMLLDDSYYLIIQANLDFQKNIELFFPCYNYAKLIRPILEDNIGIIIQESIDIYNDVIDSYENHIFKPGYLDEEEFEECKEFRKFSELLYAQQIWR